MNAAPADAEGAPADRLRWTWTVIVSLAAVCLVHGAMLWHLHDRFWHPTDDGFYAHIAERLLSGEVLHRDIQDIHPPYLHFLHELTFRAAGVDMVSLRYPLMACSILQVAFSFVLLARRGLLLAVVGSLSAGCLGVVQFFNPNPNWYCLMLVAGLTLWLVIRPRGARHRLLVSGAIVGVMTGLRHLTGVWAAMGLLALLLFERDGDHRGSNVILGRALAAVMLAGLIGYIVLTRTVGTGGLVLMAAAPLALLVLLLASSTAGTRDVVAASSQVACGFVVALLPLIAYYVWHGVLGAAATDLVLRAFGETRLPFFEPLGWYLLLPLMGLVQLTSPDNLTEAANGIYWLLLPSASLLNGLLVVAHLRRGGAVSSIIPGVIAAFFAIVSVLLEGPFYLYYSVAASVVAVLWHAGAAPRPVRHVATALAGLVGVVALASHAGQPLTRSGFALLRGQRLETAEPVRASGMRASFLLPRQEVEEYGRLISSIRSLVEPGEAMLVVPNDAQLYFLAERRNVSRFYNSALGIQDDAEWRALRQSMVRQRPRLVIYRGGDKYEDLRLQQLMAFVRERYDLVVTQAGRDLYVLKPVE